MRFVNQRAFFRRARAFSIATAQLFSRSTFGCCCAFSSRLNLLKQELARHDTVQPLLASCLTSDANAGWPVYEHHASGGLVHVLAAVSAGTDECFLQIIFANAERSHAILQL